MNRHSSNDTSWDHTAKGIAIVAGVYSLIVAALLLLNLVINQWGHPEKEHVYSTVLEEKKARLEQDPQNEALKQEIRRLDLETRQGYFQRKAFSERGKYLLLVGVVIFLLAMQRVASRESIPRKFRSKFRDPGLEARKKMQGRRAVSILGLVILGGALALASMPRINLTALSAPSPAKERPHPAPYADYVSWEEIKKNWPTFRGPGGLGISAYERVPTSWDGKTGEGILWKTKILLPGNNSPIVWGNRVYFSGADKNEKGVFCYAADKGKLLWRGRVDRVAGKRDEEFEIFEETGFAASTMACDGTRVYAIFPDGDIACFTLDGQRVWAKNLGAPESAYGYASSLQFSHNRVLVQFDQGKATEGKSVLYALDGRTGEAAWKVQRPVGNAWTSPILIQTDKGEQLVTASEPWVIAYEPDTGTELWRAKLLGSDLAPSPTYAQGMVFVIQPNRTLFALRTDGRGDVTETHLAWKKDCMAPEICSPVSNGELIFLLSSLGVLSCYDIHTGELYWEQEYPESFMASPSLAGEWLYFWGEEGMMYRVKTARTYEDGGTAQLDDRIKASPAFMDGRIILRGDEYLYCLGSESEIISAQK